MRKVIFEDLGLIDYKACWEKQEEVFFEALAIKKQNRNSPESEQIPIANHLFFVEHPHVYTLGKSGKFEHLLINEEKLKVEGATFYKINRGGDITYHGPGQIVGYPIFDLDQFFNDIHKYLRFLEEAIILTLKEYGLKAGRIGGLTGVWIDHESPLLARKIAALGVKCSRWVTMHGFAFNVNTDINYFNHIIPCGINDKAVTTMEIELGKKIDIKEVKLKLKTNLSTIFDFDY